MTHEATTPGLRSGIELLIKAADDLVVNDDDYWTRLACGQDSEESEHSGYLLGVRAGLEIANQLIGGSSPEWLISHQMTEARDISAES